VEDALHVCTISCGVQTKTKTEKRTVSAVLIRKWNISMLEIIANEVLFHKSTACCYLSKHYLGFSLTYNDSFTDAKRRVMKGNVRAVISVCQFSSQLNLHISDD